MPDQPQDIANAASWSFNNASSAETGRPLDHSLITSAIRPEDPITAAEVLNRQRELYGRSMAAQANADIAAHSARTVEMLRRAREIMQQNETITADDLMGQFDLSEFAAPLWNNGQMLRPRPTINSRMEVRLQTDFTPRNIREEMEAFRTLYGQADIPDRMFDDLLFGLLTHITPKFDWELEHSLQAYDMRINIAASYNGDQNARGQRRIIPWQGVLSEDVQRENYGASDLVRRENIGRRYIEIASPEIKSIFANMKREEFTLQYNNHVADKKPRKKTPRNKFLMVEVFRFIDRYYEVAYAYEQRDRWRGAFNQVHDEVYMGVDIARGDRNTNSYKEKPESPESATWLADMKVPEYLEAVADGKAYKAYLLNDTMKLWKESHEMGNCLYRSYTNRVMKKDYIAYHIRANHLSKSGYTIGFSRETETSRRFDQMKGKLNSNEPDGYLKMFADHLLKEVNKHYGRTNEATGLQPASAMLDC